MGKYEDISEWLETPQREDSMPVPNVLYGNMGAFLMFSEDGSRDWVACECARDPIENYKALRKLSPPANNPKPGRKSPLESLYFPIAIARLAEAGDPVVAHGFQPDICHFCCEKVPSIPYSNERPGTKIAQLYGHYFKQEWFRLGIHPGSLQVLADVCPPELAALASQVVGHRARQRALMSKHVEAVKQLHPMMTSEFTQEMSRRLESDEEHSRHRYIAIQTNRELGREIENRVREKFKLKRIGDRYVRETKMCQLLRDLHPDAELLRHYRPRWLEGLELDAYLPSLNLAFEHQGEQHYKPIAAWGGKEAFDGLQDRDQRKRQVCRQRGIRLIEIRFDEALTKEHLISRIDNVGEAITPEVEVASDVNPVVIPLGPMARIASGTLRLEDDTLIYVKPLQFEKRLSVSTITHVELFTPSKWSVQSRKRVISVHSSGTVIEIEGVAKHGERAYEWLQELVNKTAS